MNVKELKKYLDDLPDNMPVRCVNDDGPCGLSEESELTTAYLVVRDGELTIGSQI